MCISGIIFDIDFCFVDTQFSYCSISGLQYCRLGQLLGFGDIHFVDRAVDDSYVHFGDAVWNNSNAAGGWMDGGAT